MPFYEVGTKGKEGKYLACRVKRSSWWHLWSPEGSLTGQDRWTQSVHGGRAWRTTWSSLKNVSRFWRLIEDEFLRRHLELTVVVLRIPNTWEAKDVRSQAIQGELHSKSLSQKTWCKIRSNKTLKKWSLVHKGGWGLSWSELGRWSLSTEENYERTWLLRLSSGELMCLYTNVWELQLPDYIPVSRIFP